MIKVILPVSGPEEGMTQAFLRIWSVCWFFIDHALDEILCHHIFNIVQSVAPVMNVVLTFKGLVAERMVASREDIIHQHPCHLKRKHLITESLNNQENMHRNKTNLYVSAPLVWCVSFYFQSLPGLPAFCSCIACVKSCLAFR